MYLPFWHGYVHIESMEKFRRSFIVPLLIFGFTIAIVVESCKTHTLGAIVTSTYIPIYVNKNTVKHDTIPKVIQRSPIDLKKMGQFITTQYQENFNRFFAPEFRKQAETNALNAASIQKLTNLNIMIRDRGIRRFDSVQTINSNLARKIDILSIKFDSAQVLASNFYNDTKSNNRSTDKALDFFFKLGAAFALLILIIQFFINHRISKGFSKAKNL